MSGTNSYQPHKGDVVSIDFMPSRGKEIQKRRPAMVISNQQYTKMTGLALVCPITHATRNRLAHTGLMVPIKTDKTSGYVNPLQFHTFDFIQRRMQYIEQAPGDVLSQVLQTVNDIINAKET
ncbi:type II toxin-antitoxin system PemK/MazF family toxin [Lacticaseibacillus zeae]|uniref:Type II toxin-antitoxin system PemK/MazF family toxin n=1 Tax=Lacticaseibacillus zeae TaxID=57037 RepID=A0A5R8LX00_LACZE|nr:type II toxin-antitoxin system PemK/MazF family toxin [Lacticaseibacillus zeae]TLF41814.1 type II toxin-antitoxin system PemK/MazF family toxin [Lacticaseibacillus zeae]